MTGTTTTLRPGSHQENLDHTIKILCQTIVNNEVAKVGSVHTVSAQIAHMHVMAGNAGYVKEGATNRAVGVENTDSYLRNGQGRNEAGLPHMEGEISRIIPLPQFKTKPT